MKNKLIAAMVVLVIGIVMIFYAVHSMNRISSAKGAVNLINKPLSLNPYSEKVGGMLESQASQYDTPVRLLLIGGILLVVIGGGAALYLRKKQ